MTGSEEIVGISDHSRLQRLFVAQAGAADGPVTLTGEPGTGKQLTAKLIHEVSARTRSPFLMIDCSLYYERELRRELFGHGGGNPNCRPRKGLLEFARNGTCYLSRIEELSPDLQAAILRFLETGRFIRCGDGKEIESRTRIIASSDKNLLGFVQAGLFDAGLHERLSGLSARLAPLRDRREDIPGLVDFVVRKLASARDRAERVEFAPDALKALAAYPWPSNFDEILKEVRRLLDRGFTRVRCENLSMEISSYWLGQYGDPAIRKCIEELDGYIKEFQVLSHIEAGLGELVPSISDWYRRDRDPEE